MRVVGIASTHAAAELLALGATVVADALTDLEIHTASPKDPLHIHVRT